MGNNDENVNIVLTEAGIEDIEMVVRRLLEGLQAAAEVMAEIFKTATETLGEAFAALLDTCDESDAKTRRRDWPRPQNQRVRPLLLDRRCKVYHCRNAI